MLGTFRFQKRPKVYNLDEGREALPAELPVQTSSTPVLYASDRDVLIVQEVGGSAMVEHNQSTLYDYKLVSSDPQEVRPYGYSIAITDKTSGSYDPHDFPPYPPYDPNAEIYYESVTATYDEIAPFAYAMSEEWRLPMIAIIYFPEVPWVEELNLV